MKIDMKEFFALLEDTEEQLRKLTAEDFPEYPNFFRRTQEEKDAINNREIPLARQNVQKIRDSVIYKILPPKATRGSDFGRWIADSWDRNMPVTNSMARLLMLWKRLDETHLDSIPPEYLTKKKEGT